MTTEDDFQSALATQPKDWQTRLVFADWLQEHNDPRAEGYRAMGMRRVMPCLFKSADAWVWLNAHYAAGYGKRNEIRAATLPDDWYARLPRARGMDCAEERRKLRAALNDAARAFAKLSPERRAELLVPVSDPPRKKQSYKKPVQKPRSRKKLAPKKPIQKARSRKK